MLFEESQGAEIFALCKIHKGCFLLDFGPKKSCSNLRRAEKPKSREVALGSLITNSCGLERGAVPRPPELYSWPSKPSSSFGSALRTFRGKRQACGVS